MKKKHGHNSKSGRTPTYNSWRAMKERCHNPNKDKYSYYGGRGIIVHKRWHEFTNFLEDMGPRPNGKTLDRINPNEDYEPGNCRWATSQQQAYNKRR